VQGASQGPVGGVEPRLTCGAFSFVNPFRVSLKTSMLIYITYML
jgi:hypothetical protein